MRGRFLIAALAGAGALTLAGAAASGQPSASASATAGAAAYLVGGSPGPQIAIASRGSGSRSASGSPEDGKLYRVRGGRVEVHTSIADGQGTASASVTTRGVELFASLVSATAIEIGSNGEGRVSGRITDLAIGAGLPIGDITRHRVFDLDGKGTVETFGPTADGGVAALRARLDRDHAGFPAGTEILVGKVAASARDAAVRRPAPVVPRPRLGGEIERRSRSAERVRRRARRAGRSDRARRRSRERRLRRRAVDRVRRGDFLFPIFGGASVSDDYGAPRASTRRPHAGNDLFAPFGAPVLAVADGTIFKVGTLPISGNRLWLRDRQGNTFFYAHLSAFSHRAVNGAVVRAGDVLGFTGSTGDAKPTPPHLHFEIHPADGDPVNPHGFLRRWRRGSFRAERELSGRYAPEAPPGVLVELRDFIAE